MPTVIGTVAVFGFLLTRTNPMPLIRETAYQMSLQQLVSFEHAIPERLDESISVQSVHREDTDGDGENEWVVFYQFDLQNGTSPVKGVVYDSDRGNPPVVFPYRLQVPDRDYLSEGTSGGVPGFELLEVVSLPNESVNVNELMVSDTTRMSIFRFVQNSEPWDFPRDAPARYQPIGSFFGNGGVEYNSTTKNVTVIDRSGYERSQLAVRSIYQLQPNNTYWDTFDPNLLSAQLSAPIISTIDFFEQPPADIFTTPYPEKIVLGFYTATCGLQDDTLCLNRDATSSWDYQNFLAGDALIEAQNNNAGYFGLPSFSTSDISVTNLRYFPRLETDPDLLVSGGGRDVVTGEEGQFNLVDITFSVDGRLDTVRYEMQLVEGLWKIVQRLPIGPTPVVGPTAQISGPDAIVVGDTMTFGCSESQPGNGGDVIYNRCVWTFDGNPPNVFPGEIVSQGAQEFSDAPPQESPQPLPLTPEEILTMSDEEVAATNNTNPELTIAENASKTAGEPGQITVTLMAIDQSGEADIKTKTVTVNPKPLPTQEPCQQQTNPCAPKW
ncbi:MAG: hypothetical protein KDJ65_22175 [Anaerolineae bacterium]|nr:hypothetical protein [Anaerolineae bacterium]